jgi:hypothetical protein
MKIGDRIYVRGYVDEIRKDTVIVRNNGGYFGTIPSEVITGELPSAQPEIIRCKDCKHWMMGKTTKNYPNPYICELHSFMHGFERSALPEDYCSWAELRGDSDD